ncbi:MAG: 16S rRNA (guanine(527)-N(7))-methyltransferase RsmG [Flavobacteriales bacterium]|nr:16S rRNA (guanine(527)-N(7))-methyltransferase RsmG [Flavobacteriales bacterium]
MAGLDLLLSYFPDLSPEQRDRFAALGPLYREWNERVNLISRKDIEHLYERHVLHSLGIAKVLLEDVTLSKPALSEAEGPKRRSFIDVGTGGGFPLIPLAIMFPESTFHGIDGIGKKIMAVNGVIEVLGLTNCTAEKVRSEDHKARYDIIISRAVTTLPEFIRATKHLVTKGQGRMLYLKGGDIMDEIAPVRDRVRVHHLREFFTEEFFGTKKVVDVAM